MKDGIKAMNQYDTDMHYMRQAYEYAENMSQDPDTHSGCVIRFPGSTLTIFGTNKLPQGIKPESYMFEKPAKYDYFEHAEKDGISLAHRSGIVLQGAHIYINWKSCMPCSRMIINAGIKRVIIHKEGQETYERLANINKGGDWHEIDSIEFMRSAGIEVDYLSMDFGGEVKARFRGVDVKL